MSSPGNDYKQTRRIILAAICFALASASVLIIAFGDITRTSLVTSAALALTAGVFLCAHWVISLRAYTQTRRPPYEHSPDDSYDTILHQAAEFDLYLDAVQASTFTDLIYSSTSATERITESVEPLSRSVHISTTASILLPAQTVTTLRALPLALFRRGELLDGLKIWGPTGERLTSFARASAAAYTAAVIRRLIAPLGEAALETYRDTLEPQVIQLVSAATPTAPVDVQRLTDGIVMLPSDHRSRWPLLRVCELLRVLATHYPLVVQYLQPALGSLEAGTPIRTRFTVERRALALFMPHQEKSFQGFADRVRDSVRQFLGAPSALLSFPLSNSQRGGSYHLEVKGPPGTYLARQRIVEYPTGREAALDDCHYAMRARMGQRNSHLYIHGGRNLSDKYFENYFFEKVPGSIGVATMSALGAAILVGLIASNHLGLTRGPHSDIILALLALPAIVGAWAGIDTSESQLGQALVARVVNLFTIATSLVAAGAYVSLPATESDSVSTVYERTGWSIWTVLVGVSVVNLTAASASWILRASAQRMIRNRKDRLGD